jgi:hypothetical protein
VLLHVVVLNKVGLARPFAALETFPHGRQRVLVSAVVGELSMQDCVRLTILSGMTATDRVDAVDGIACIVRPLAGYLSAYVCVWTRERERVNERA